MRTTGQDTAGSRLTPMPAGQGTRENHKSERGGVGAALEKWEGKKSTEGGGKGEYVKKRGVRVGGVSVPNNDDLSLELSNVDGKAGFEGDAEPFEAVC